MKPIASSESRWARKHAGFTLIELLIVLVLISVLSVLAIPSLQQMAKNQTLSNTSSDFMGAILQARSAALSNNRRTLLQPLTGTDWRTGWRIYIDMNTNGTYDAGTDTLIASRDAMDGDINIGALSGSGDNVSITVIGFNGDGFLTTIGTSLNGSILLQSTLTGRKKYVVVSRVGRARICDPITTPGCEPS